MTQLNGKAKEKFLIEYYKESIKNNWDLNELEYIFNMLPEICQNALIIEFFDSVGIYISVFKDYDTFEFYINDDWAGGEENRQEATKEAIIKANDLYNNTDKV